MSVAQSLPVGQIVPGNNPRTFFDPEEMRELTDSVRANGIIQPILVRPVGPDAYEIVAGERRWRAAREAFGNDCEIPVLVRDLSDEEAETAALVENTARANMSATEEARRAQLLMRRHDNDREEVARTLGWSQKKLDSRLALTNLVPEVTTALDERKIALGHAELLAAAPREKQASTLQKIIEHNLSVAFVRSALLKAAQDLGRAIFDKSECANCPSNSDRQSALFSEAIESGHCTNETCYTAKSETALSAKCDALRDEVQTIRIVRLGESHDTRAITASGNLGVGEEQAKACRGCANFGATVSALPDSMGRVVSDLCFDGACHAGKVTAHLRATTPQKTVVAKPAAKGKTPNKASATNTSNEVPSNVKMYRVAQWRTFAACEIGANPHHAAALMLALIASHNASTFSGSKAVEAIGAIAERTGNFAQHFSALKTASPEQHRDVATQTAVSALATVSENVLVDVMRAIDLDLSRHWTINAEFLGLLTKSGIEALASEIGLAAHMGDAYKKAVSGKKAEVIAALLKAEGFDFGGIVPQMMRYEPSSEDNANQPIAQDQDEDSEASDDPEAGVDE